MGTLQEKQQYKTTDLRYEQYAVEHTTPEDALLASLVRETNLAFNTPSMLSGNLQGQFLKMLCHMLQPQMVLEVGTFTGYSAIVMAQALQPGAILHTIDNNPEVADIAQKYIKKSGLSDKIITHQGSGLDVIPTLDGPFDLVFIDADKENYLNYYEAVLPKLHSGGFIIADNVLWYGKVLNPDALEDKETRGIAVFNNHINNDERIEHLLLPIRDGLMMIRKR